MSKFLIGVGAGALWLALSHMANAESVCRQVCDNGTCVSKCVEHPDSEVIVRDRDRPRDERPDAPGVGVHVPGVDIGIGR
jgi:hypothetical protein